MDHLDVTFPHAQISRVKGGEYLMVYSDGRLVCIMRRQAGNWQEMMPLAISFSDDDGYHWSDPRAIDHLGVWPILTHLKNGVLVLGYGRPGAHLIFSSDGTGINGLNL